MNFKTTYILFGALVGLSAVWGCLYLLSSYGIIHLGKSAAAELYVMNDMHKEKVTADQIDTVEIEHNRPKAEKMVFVRRDRGWHMTIPHDMRVQGFLVDQVLSQILDAQREENADVTSSLKDVGLDTPEITVTLKKNADKEWKLNLGNQTLAESANGLVYVTTTGRPKEPVAVKRSQVETIFKPMVDFWSKDLVTESALNLTSVSVQETGKAPLVLEKTQERQWRFVQPPYGEADYEGQPAGPETDPNKVSGVRQLLEDIEKIRVESDADFVAEDVQDFAQYGLEAGKPERLRIEIKQRVGSLLGGDQKQEPVQNVLLVGKKADDKGTMLFARLESESTVVKIPVRSIEPIIQVEEKPDAIRNRDLVQADPFAVDAVDIKGPRGLVKLRRPQREAWELGNESKGTTKADFDATEQLVDSLTAKGQALLPFPDPAKEAELGFNGPDVVAVSIWVNGLQKVEKKEDKPEEKKDEKKDKATPPEAEPKLKDEQHPTARLTFGKREDKVVYVRKEAGADKTLLAVPVARYDQVNQEMLNFLDRTLPSSLPGSEVKLTITRGDGTSEVEKKEENGKGVWTFKQPTDLAGRHADSNPKGTGNLDNLLSVLRDLRPRKVAAVQPTDAQLEEFGLKTPSASATVTLNKDQKPPLERTYFFGKKTKEGDGVYAGLDKKTDERDYVYVVPDQLDVLQAELRERQLFHFDAAKVKQLKLTGWMKALGLSEPQTLDLERKADNTWTVKSGPPVNLDDQKVEAFLKSLSGLVADRYLKGGPQPAYKLEGKELPLRIEIGIPDEKQNLTLAIGDVDPETKDYYAGTSQPPKEVYLVKPEPFKDLLGGYKYFSK